MPKYDLSTHRAITEAAVAARKNAGEEPNQNSYNAAYLHGYADALREVSQQLVPPPEVVAVIRKTYADIVTALNEAEALHKKWPRSVLKRQNFQFLAAQELVISDLAHSLGIELHDENLNPIQPSNVVMVEHNGKKMVMTAEQIEAAYSYERNQSLRLDAEAHLNDLVFGIDPNFLCDDDMQKAKADFNARYGIAAEDAYGMLDIFVTYFKKLEDCNCDENSTWRTAIMEALKDNT